MARHSKTLSPLHIPCSQGYRPRLDSGREGNPIIPSTALKDIVATQPQPPKRHREKELEPSVSIFDIWKFKHKTSCKGRRNNVLARRVVQARLIPS